MPTLIDRFIQRTLERVITNKFNQAFYGTVGGHYTQYDTSGQTYLEEGLLKNPIVSAIVGQRADKAKQIPSYVKKIKNKNAKRRLDRFNQSTKWFPTNQQFIKSLELKNKAFEEEFMDFPMEKPNELQTWGEIDALYETFMATTGNYYEYHLKGDLSSEPVAVYPLPSHLMKIVLKPNASMLGVESPIDYYMMIEGNTYVKFEADNVMHVKLPNPDYGQNGEHLYGLSPLRAALRNIQSSNLAVDLNNDTMLNGGAFGFIHGMETPLTSDQGNEIKARLKEMRASKDVLGKIQGSSAKLGFTQVRMSAKDMELFKYLDWDEKQIANNLKWSNVLLNSEAKGDYGGTITAEERRVVSNTTMPSLQLLDEARNDRFLPLFKGYENAIIEHDPSDLPEMQQDMKTLMEWIGMAVDKGIMNRATAQKYLKLEVEENDLMNQYTVSTDVFSLEEALNNDFVLNGPQDVQD